ncbi:cell division protein DivIB [Clostridium tepidiprofundi DSM 19306]|uniref:Cell division protein DivIB n=2 Tax=Clostridium TaxID=1485 RepID=A0A151B6X4_9CLOT|nr:cell division protein DivIB [Clostridium tepidiprofundi DSM 19306]
MVLYIYEKNVVMYMKRKSDSMYNKAKYIIDNKDKLINRRIAFKRMRMYLFITMIFIGIAITLCLKLSMFNITQINVVGNNVVNYNDIILSSHIKKGMNIFRINVNEAIKSIEGNPHILSAIVKRKLPNVVRIDVRERKAKFYAYFNNKYFIIDNYGVIIDVKSDISDMRLIKLDGFDFSKAQLGEVLPCEDERKVAMLDEISNIIKNNRSNVKISIVDLSNMADINFYCGSMQVKLGTNRDLIKKLDKAFDIIIKENIVNKKGYVDVSFSGNPVIYTD